MSKSITESKTIIVAALMFVAALSEAYLGVPIDGPTQLALASIVMALLRKVTSESIE